MAAPGRRPRAPDALRALALATAVLGLCGCGETAKQSVEQGTGEHPSLPAPDPALLPTVHIAPATGWPAGRTPQAAAGTQVAAFATGLAHPRWLLVLPNGDVLVAETGAPPQPGGPRTLKAWVMGLVMKRAGAGVASANRITLLRDANGDGVAETRSVLVAGLNSPFGMALIGERLYVANADAVVSFPYRTGDTALTAGPTPLLDLPGGPINHHWTKNLLASPDGHTLYVAIGSNSNVAERGMAVEEGRAAIWAVNVQTGAHRVFASGLRNPVGMAWEPTAGTLWAVVNERDELGSDLVPDYLTAVREGAFYGWPYSYYGAHVDARVQPPSPGLVATAVVPDYALGPHTAPAGAGRCHRQHAAAGAARGHVRRPARLLEPAAAQRLPGGLRALPPGPPGRATGRGAGRVSGRGGPGARPPGGRGAGPARRPARGRRCGQHRLARHRGTGLDRGALTPQARNFSTRKSTSARTRCGTKRPLGNTACSG